MQDFDQNIGLNFQGVLPPTVPHPPSSSNILLSAATGCYYIARVMLQNFDTSGKYSNTNAAFVIRHSVSSRGGAKQV